MNPVDGQKLPKKRKLVDRNLPPSILADPTFALDSKMYQDLVEMEKKLDWTMMRKRTEVQDALGRTASSTRTLRLFISHTVSGQAWQTAEAGGEPSFETGQGIPAWQFKIEGRLLELPNQRSRDKAPHRAFSTFIKHMHIEFDRDVTLYPDGNIVEWHRGATHAPLDGFTIRRMGDQPTKARILLHVEHYPEQFKVHPDLGSVLGIKEDSRAGVIQTLWNYIKINGLQDKADRKRIHIDAALRPIFQVDAIPFHILPDVVNRFLGPPEAITIHYTINPQQPPPERPQAWDIEVKMEDLALKAKMTNVTVGVQKEGVREIMQIDEKIALLAQSLHSSILKKQFMQAFADDPAKFIQTFLESQSRDLESILASGPSEGASVRTEDLHRSDFWKMGWVEEAVAVWDGIRLAAKPLGQS